MMQTPRPAVERCRSDAPWVRRAPCSQFGRFGGCLKDVDQSRVGRWRGGTESDRRLSRSGFVEQCLQRKILLTFVLASAMMWPRSPLELVSGPEVRYSIRFF